MPDEVKLDAVELLFAEFSKLGGKFFRIGYYNASVPFLLPGKEHRVQFCLWNTLMALKDDLRKPYALVHEMD
jgi:hypothetical protein